MSIDVVRQAVAQLTAIAADRVLTAPSLEVLQPQRIHCGRIPDLLHGLRTHVADHELAAPVKKAGADQAISIYRIAIEDIRTRIGIADVLLIDPFADLHAGMFLYIELRPARREILHKDAVAVIAEGVEEFLALRLGNKFGRNFYDDFARALVGVDPFDVVDKFSEIKFEAGEAEISFFVHSVD